MKAALRTALALSLVAGCGGRAPAPASIAKTAGDLQTGVRQQALPIGPSVRVTDSHGAPVPNLKVSCEIANGGGRVSQPEGLTGDDGVGTCGAWYLGPTSGLNQLKVTVQGLDPVVFAAASVLGTEAFLMQLRVPGGQLGPAALDVQVDAQDVSPVFRMVATFADQTFELTNQSPGATQTTFSGTFDLSGVPAGTLDALVVHATDEQLRAAEVGTMLVVDQQPELFVSAPADRLRFSRPQVQLNATASGATDVVITASVHGKEVARATNLMLATVDLSEFDHQIDEIVFHAADAYGLSAEVTRSVWVSSNPGVALAAQVDGVARDFDGTRALHGVNGDLFIATPSAGTDQPLFPGSDTSHAALTPLGAVACPNQFFGGLIDIGDLRLVGSPCTGFAAAGHSIAYTDSNAVWIWDLELPVPVPAGSGPTSPLSLAANGELVFTNGVQKVVESHPDGGTSFIPPPDSHFRYSPVTDGTLVAYLACVQTPCPSLAVWDGAQEQLIPTDYLPEQLALNNGWLVWTVRDSGAQPQTWELHFPGVPGPIAQGMDVSRLDAVLPNGTVVLESGQKLWRVAPGKPPLPFLDLSTPDEPPFSFVERGGHTYFLFGGTVLEVLP